MERSVVNGASTVPVKATLSTRPPAKILLAESSLLDQIAAVRGLQTDGHDVTLVATGRQALASLQQNTFDLIVMEAEMPELNGCDATGIIRRNEATLGGHIPIVAMVSDVAQGNEALQAGMDQFIAKPLNLDQLRQAVASCLPPAEAPPVFDLTAALAQLNGDGDFLYTIASMFLEDSPGLIAEIRTAIEQQDGHRLERSAHTLKGSATPFLASAVTDAAQTLESMGRSGQLATAMQEYSRLEKAISPLLTALSALTPHADLLLNNR